MPVQPAPARRWTEEEFYQARDQAPPGERWELVDGEVLVTPSPHWVHQRIIARLYLIVAPYVQQEALGEAFLSPLDVRLERGLILQPDLLVVPSGELRKRDDVIRHLLLAAEILSPSSSRHDRVRKRPVYQRNRVPEYWVVDPDAQLVERWRPEDDRPEILDAHLSWHPSGATAPLTLDLVQFFGDVIPPE